MRAGRLHLYTGVRPHHLGGWLYLALVWPFHWPDWRRSSARMAALLGGGMLSATAALRALG